MKWLLCIFFFVVVSCTGQDRILQEDLERGIKLRQTNIQTIGCWGEKGVGGTPPTVRLEVSDPSGSYAIPDATDCGDELSFDATKQPVRIRCKDEVRPLYRLGTTVGVLGEPGNFEPMHEAADSLVEKRGIPVLKALLTEAHKRGVMVETLVELADTDCQDYWQVSFEGLSVAEQKRTLDEIRSRPGGSELRKKRLQKNTR